MPRRKTINFDDFDQEFIVERPNTVGVVNPRRSLETQIKQLEHLIKNPPVNSVVMTITPELANYILDNLNKKNREIKPKTKKFAADMKAHKWEHTGDTVKFGRSGRLRDGQNRLNACVLAGVPFVTDVKFGVRDAAFVVMDTGTVRSNKDCFAIDGVPNWKAAAPAIRWLHILTGPNPTSRSQTLTNDVALSTYQNFSVQEKEDFNRCVDYAIDIEKKLKKLIPAGQLAALFFLFNKSNPRVFNVFLGDFLAKEPARGINVLTRYIRKLGNTVKTYFGDPVRYAAVVLCWNTYVTKGPNQVTEKAIQWNYNVDFPEIH